MTTTEMAAMTMNATITDTHPLNERQHLDASHNLRLYQVAPEDIEALRQIMKEAFETSAPQEFREGDPEGMPRESELTFPLAADRLCYTISFDGTMIGGLVIRTGFIAKHNKLELFFIAPAQHGKGLGLQVWNLVEAMFPDVDVWETDTPSFAQRNVHFYVNKCGFHIVEAYCQWHKDPREPEENFGDHMHFRFEKRIQRR